MINQQAYEAAIPTNSLQYRFDETSSSLMPAALKWNIYIVASVKWDWLLQNFIPLHKSDVECRTIVISYSHIHIMRSLMQSHCQWKQVELLKFLDESGWSRGELRHIPPAPDSLTLPSMQVLAGGAGPEEDASAGRGPAGSGHLGGVPGWGRPQLHQPGLSQLRAHQPEPEGPRALQLRGRAGEDEHKGTACHTQARWRTRIIGKTLHLCCHDAELCRSSMLSEIHHLAES